MKGNAEIGIYTNLCDFCKKDAKIPRYLDADCFKGERHFCCKSCKEEYEELYKC